MYFFPSFSVVLIFSRVNLFVEIHSAATFFISFYFVTRRLGFFLNIVTPAYGKIYATLLYINSIVVKGNS